MANNPNLNQERPEAPMQPGMLDQSVDATLEVTLDATLDQSMDSNRFGACVWFAP